MEDFSFNSYSTGIKSPEKHRNDHIIQVE